MEQRAAPCYGNDGVKVAQDWTNRWRERDLNVLGKAQQNPYRTPALLLRSTLILILHDFSLKPSCPVSNRGPGIVFLFCGTASLEPRGPFPGAAQPE